MSNTFKIFIVEDDPWYGELLKYHLSLNDEYQVELFQSGKACIAQLHLKPQVVCIDFGLPDMDGEVLLKSIKQVNPSLPVVIISGQEDIAVAVNLLKLGAYDYIIKGDNTKELLWNSIIKVRETSALREEVEELREELSKKYDFEKSIIGQSPAIKRTFTLIEKAIRTNINVSITGETGTGKEVIAKAIHYNGPNRKKPFVAVNMSAIPKDLIESELFGHEKGAFTGANTRKIGKFEEVKDGTLFLDEIAELDINLQSKILRVLQERELTRIGGSEVVKLNFRLISATHKDLLEETKKGNFREDLYYRMIGLPIHLAPLRERGHDILILAKHFVDEFATANKLGKLQITDDAKDKLLKYSYPGNVRELKAIIDLACVMCDEKQITADDITFTSVREEEIFTRIEKSLQEYEADIINHFLKKYNNDVLLVADKLKVGKSTIYRMIKAGQVYKN